MYFITSVGPDDTRCVGYYSNSETAIATVVNNCCDLYEAGCYPYVVIENVREGLYNYDWDPQWFKYNEKTEKYEKSGVPPFVGKHEIGFGIG